MVIFQLQHLSNESWLIISGCFSKDGQLPSCNVSPIYLGQPQTTQMSTIFIKTNKKIMKYQTDIGHQQYSYL